MRRLEKFSMYIYFIVIMVIMTVLIGYVCGIRTYITMSGSMEPSIKTGSICIVDTQVTYDEIKAGDVIVFSTLGDRLVTHRVISITEDGIETKGDNNNVSDGISTTNQNFVGKTLFSIPYVGYVISYCQNLYVMIGIISLILILLVFLIIDNFFYKETTTE